MTTNVQDKGITVTNTQAIWISEESAWYWVARKSYTHLYMGTQCWHCGDVEQVAFSQCKPNEYSLVPMRMDGTPKYVIDPAA